MDNMAQWIGMWNANLKAMSSILNSGDFFTHNYSFKKYNLLT